MVVSRLMLGPVTIVSPFSSYQGQPPVHRTSTAPVFPTPRLFYVLRFNDGGPEMRYSLR
jgi:hypothetical protein